MINSRKKSFFYYYLADTSSGTEILDIYLISEARRLNKTVGSLETAESNCEVINKYYFLNIFVQYFLFIHRKKVGVIIYQHGKWL